MNTQRITQPLHRLPALALVAAYALTIQCLPLDQAGPPEEDAAARIAGFVGAQGLSSGSDASGLSDLGDGTVTFGPQNLEWAKCGQASAAGANAYGGGGSSDDCTANGGPVGLMYCSATDNSCNGGTITGLLDGGGASEAYQSCAALTLGGHSDWRVPNQNALAGFLFGAIGSQSAVFPNVLSGPLEGRYWSSNSTGTADAIAASIEEIGVGQFTKTNPLRVFCTRHADG